MRDRILDSDASFSTSVPFQFSSAYELSYLPAKLFERNLLLSEHMFLKKIMCREFTKRSLTHFEDSGCPASWMYFPSIAIRRLARSEQSKIGSLWYLRKSDVVSAQSS